MNKREKRIFKIVGYCALITLVAIIACVVFFAYNHKKAKHKIHLTKVESSAVCKPNDIERRKQIDEKIRNIITEKAKQDIPEFIKVCNAIRLGHLGDSSITGPLFGPESGLRAEEAAKQTVRFAVNSDYSIFLDIRNDVIIEFREYANCFLDDTMNAKAIYDMETKIYVILANQDFRKKVCEICEAALVKLIDRDDKKITEDGEIYSAVTNKNEGVLEAIDIAGKIARTVFSLF